MDKPIGSLPLIEHQAHSPSPLFMAIQHHDPMEYHLAHPLLLFLLVPIELLD